MNMAKRRSVALIRAEKQLASAKARASRLAKRVNQAPVKRIAYNTAGGAMVALLEKYSPVQEIMNVPVSGVASIALIVAGTNMKGNTSEMLTELGAGMGAVAGYQISKKYV